MRHYAMNAVLDCNEHTKNKHRTQVQLAKTELPAIYAAIDKLSDGETKLIILTMMFFDYMLDLKYETNTIKSKFDVYTAIQTFFEGPLKSMMTIAVKAHMDKVKMSDDVVKEFLEQLVGKADEKVH